MNGKAIRDGEGKGYENTEEYTSLAMNYMEDMLYRKKKQTWRRKIGKQLNVHRLFRKCFLEGGQKCHLSVLCTVGSCFFKVQEQNHGCEVHIATSRNQYL